MLLQTHAAPAFSTKSHDNIEKFPPHDPLDDLLTDVRRDVAMIDTIEKREER